MLNLEREDGETAKVSLEAQEGTLDPQEIMDLILRLSRREAQLGSSTFTMEASSLFA